MRLESRYQSSTSGTFSLTKKSFPPLFWADKAGSVGAVVHESTRIVDTRARRPPPSASGSEGDRLPRARADSRTRLRRPLLPPAPPREGFGFHSPNPPPARRLAQATHSGTPTRSSCRGGSPAPGGPGARETEAGSQADARARRTLAAPLALLPSSFSSNTAGLWEWFPPIFRRGSCRCCSCYMPGRGDAGCSVRGARCGVPSER